MANGILALWRSTATHRGHDRMTRVTVWDRCNDRFIVRAMW